MEPGSVNEPIRSLLCPWYAPRLTAVRYLGTNLGRQGRVFPSLAESPEHGDPPLDGPLLPWLSALIPVSRPRAISRLQSHSTTNCAVLKCCNNMHEGLPASKRKADRYVPCGLESPFDDARHQKACTKHAAYIGNGILCCINDVVSQQVACYSRPLRYLDAALVSPALHRLFRSAACSQRASAWRGRQKVGESG